MKELLRSRGITARYTMTGSTLTIRLLEPNRMEPRPMNNTCHRDRVLNDLQVYIDYVGDNWRELAPHQVIDIELRIKGLWEVVERRKEIRRKT